MDFNCLIYHCLRRPGMAGLSGDGLEKRLLDEVVAYCEKVVAEVRPTDGVFIAVDGVVPMAKMRQQRLRRFKNAATAAAGDWDTNAITPGTAFMDRLRVRLAAVCAVKKGWRLSAADEAGEGEHKIMAEWRRGAAAVGSHNAVYGLDADLIVLSLLNAPGPTWLFREEIEAGVIKRDDAGEESFTWFDVECLKGAVCGSVAKQNVFLRDYCCAMSFLGNDFLPSSLSFKMREDGHPALIDILNKMTTAGKHLVGTDGEISADGLACLLQHLAAEEAPRLLGFIKKKMRMATNIGVETGPGQENWPLAVCAEGCLLGGGSRHATALRADWQSIYLRTWFGKGTTVADVTGVYMRGVYWVWDYYRGKDVCYNWHYPWTLPPLWAWLAAASGATTGANAVAVRATDILPAEQLALVLPLRSWHLIPVGKMRQLPAVAPWLFPTKFDYSSVGRRFFWECEAEIPVPTILEIKALCA